MRCFEVLNLMDIGEVVFLSALERKETRGHHKRADYPYTNPYMKKYLIVKQVNGAPVFDWEELGRAWTRPNWE